MATEPKVTDHREHAAAVKQSRQWLPRGWGIMAGAGKPRSVPDTSDPLSEGDPRRRLWAAYLRAGFTRAEFARAIGISYPTLDAWDTGKRQPDLYAFAKAASLVGYTVDELLHGHGGQASRGGAAVEPALSTDGVRTLLDQLRATVDQCRGLAEHRESPRGIYTRFTPTYVRAFIAGYAAAAEQGADHAHAVDSAADQAEHAQAMADAHARGVRPVAPTPPATVAARVAKRLDGGGAVHKPGGGRGGGGRGHGTAAKRPAKPSRQRID